LSVDEEKKELFNKAKEGIIPISLVEKELKKIVDKEQEEYVASKAFDKTPVINFGEGEWRLRYYEEKFHIKR